MKYNGPKARRVRRQGTNIYGVDKYDKILQKKPHGPGKDPRGKTEKQSEYGKQLQEKQKARDMYGLSESQFRRLYQMASKVKGQTGEALKQLLERRLDNVVYRAGFALTRLQARQFVGHGLFAVNGQRVTIPSYQVKPGEVVEVRARSKTSPVFASITAAHEKYMPPAWLKVEGGNLRLEVVSLPPPEAAEQGIDTRQIIEFYSR